MRFALTQSRMRAARSRVRRVNHDTMGSGEDTQARGRRRQHACTIPASLDSKSVPIDYGMARAIADSAHPSPRGREHIGLPLREIRYCLELA